MVLGHSWSGPSVATFPILKLFTGFYTASFVLPLCCGSHIFFSLESPLLPFKATVLSDVLFWLHQEMTSLLNFHSSSFQSFLHLEWQDPCLVILFILVEYLVYKRLSVNFYQMFADCMMEWKKKPSYLPRISDCLKPISMTCFARNLPPIDRYYL